MDNVLKITEEWDFDGLWGRCDDIFIVLVSLLLIGLGFFIAKNESSHHHIHHIHHGVRHTVPGPPAKDEEDEEEEDDKED